MESKAKKLPLKTKFGWSSLAMSAAVSYTLLAYLTLYATDVLKLEAGIVSMILVVSKVFDGVSDVIVGVLIDKTHTRFGKARPYALGIVGYWFAVALLFSVPMSFSNVMKYVWLFLMYTLAYSVFATLYACAEAPHLANACEDSNQNLSLISFAAVASSIMGLIAGIAVPQFAKYAGTDASAWRTMVWILAIPLALMGTLRFFLVKEVRNVKAEKTADRASLKEIVGAIKQNKYIGILAILVFLAYFATNLSGGAGNYYNKYIIGDVGAGSIMSIALLPMIIMMAIVPALAKKYTLKRVVNVTMVLGMVGSLIRFLDPSSIPLNFIATALYGLSFQAFYGFAGTMVIECIDYGQWKTGVRVEGVMGSVQSVMNKVGSALGTGASGLLLSLSGYDGNLEVQSTATLTMIQAIVGVIPAIMAVVFIVIFRFYDLEKKMPQVREDLKKESV